MTAAAGHDPVEAAWLLLLVVLLLLSCLAACAYSARTYGLSLREWWDRLR